MTPVIFRRDPETGETVAILPTVPAKPGHLACYAHIGQHAECSLDWYYSTSPAETLATAALAAELEGAGYSGLQRETKLKMKWRNTQ